MADDIYRLIIHKNQGAKGTTEYFVKYDIEGHDEQIRAEEREKLLKELLEMSADWVDNHGSFLDFQRVLLKKLEQLKEQE